MLALVSSLLRKRYIERSCRAAWVWLSFVIAAGWPAILPVSALECVSFRNGQSVQTVCGRILITAQDGGVLLQDRAGALWAVQPEQIVDRKSTAEPFRPFSPEQMAEYLLGQLPQGFKVYRTRHYTIVHQTSMDYARWCGALFERLYSSFSNYWQRRGIELSEPEFPLVAIVFPDRQSFRQYAEKEAGPAAASIIGYYNLQTNLMVMFDLTGAGSLERRPSVSSRAMIQQFLRQADAQRNISTIVHEATHQICFNCGLFDRAAECPLWLAEGIAIYFESPDYRSSLGWRSIGKVNVTRLQRFLNYLSRRPADSLQTLVGGDERFRRVDEAEDAYAEAWALTYYLVNRRPEQFCQYVQLISELPPGLPYEEEKRLADFASVFGNNWQQLDREFLEYITQVAVRNR